MQSLVLIFINEFCQVASTRGCTLMNKEIENGKKFFQHSAAFPPHGSGEKRSIHFKGLKTGGVSSMMPVNTCLENNKAVASCFNTSAILLQTSYAQNKGSSTYHRLHLSVQPLCARSHIIIIIIISGVGSITKPIQTS